MRLVECIPNFSEGRDPAVLASIIAAMVAVPGVYLLAQEMDADHHRSVVTLAGEPGAVAEAAVRGVGAAARLIDLRRHQGAHPRIGATDVVPFVPLQGVTLEDCVALAEWTGAEIWKRFAVPVYFYEAAARTPERRQLEHIRRGQFEGLSESARSDPARRPDLGDAALHPAAGATVVGARKFLIAYNINLDTNDLEVARAIAKTIRTSSGGMPAVKAMGVRLEAKHCAQVSMNLTDFETTSLATVWNAVGAEAAKLGARATESELIGLAPRRALEQAAAELLRFDVFNPDMVVENRVATVMSNLPVRLGGQLQPFLDALASDAPAPGGGSAAAAAAAMAAALGEMVARLGQKKAEQQALKSGSPVDLDSLPFAAAGRELAALRERLLRAVDQDSEAFLAIRAAFRLPKSSPEEKQLRAEAVAAATLTATEVPLLVATMARQVRDELRRLEAHTPPAMASDRTTGLALADAAFSGARDNVRINLTSLPPDHPEGRRLAAAISQLEQL